MDSITPYTMALIAKYIARHRLRETRLLDTIADFLVKKAEYLDSKVRTDGGRGASVAFLRNSAGVFVRSSPGDPKAGVPIQQDELPPVQRAAVLLPAGGGGGAEGAQLTARHRQHPHVSVPAGTLPRPRAAPRLLLGIHQQRHQYVCPVPPIKPLTLPVRLFDHRLPPAPAPTDSPYALIVRRYLSLLDAAVELEYRDYTGPRLQDAHKVLMFDHALTADEVNRKYR